MRARQNITAVSNDSEYIAAYRKGMTVMKSRPDLDPTSWMYWVNIHWRVPEDMKNIRSQCERSQAVRGFPICEREKEALRETLKKASRFRNCGWRVDICTTALERCVRNGENGCYEALAAAKSMK